MHSLPVRVFTRFLSVKIYGTYPTRRCYVGVQYSTVTSIRYEDCKSCTVVFCRETEKSDDHQMFDTKHIPLQLIICDTRLFLSGNTSGVPRGYLSPPSPAATYPYPSMILVFFYPGTPRGYLPALSSSLSPMIYDTRLFYPGIPREYLEYLSPPSPARLFLSGNETEEDRYFFFPLFY